MCRSPYILAAGSGIKTVVNVRSGITYGAGIHGVGWVNFVFADCHGRPIASLERINPTSKLREGGFCEMSVRTTVQSIDLFLEGLD